MKTYNDDPNLLIDDAINKLTEDSNGPNELDSINFDIYVSPADVSRYAHRNGWEESEEFDCNGWQYDWWISYKKDNIEFLFAGCGHDGSSYISKPESA